MNVPDGITVNCEDEGLNHAYFIDELKLTAVARTICGHLGVAEHDLSIILASAAHVRQLNKDYRGLDRSTDVLSFPQSEWQRPLLVQDKPQPLANTAASGPPPVLGDVVISLADASSNAAKIGQTLDREVAFLLVHGILHLCGHDHLETKDEELMVEQQQKLMAILAPPASLPLWSMIVQSRIAERPS